MPALSALPAGAQTVVDKLLSVWDKAAPHLKTALHWGYIPAIILLGMTQTEPRPSWGQLLGPM